MGVAVLVGDQYRDNDPRSGGRIVRVVDSPDRPGEVLSYNPVYAVVTIKSDKPTAMGRWSWLRRKTLLKRFTYLPKGSPSYVQHEEES